MTAIVTSAVLLALAVLAYRRDLGPERAVPLLVLRLAVLVLLAGVLTNAVIRRAWTIRPQRVVVLVDRSSSMSTAGLDSAAGAAARALPLPARAVRDPWEFADSAVRSDGAGARRVDSSRTRLARALELAGRTRPGAIILVSDGQDNGESDPVAAARRTSVPVYTVGFGAGGRRNAAVTGVVLPAVVYAGDTVEANVRVASRGMAGERLAVRFQGQVQEAVAGADAGEQELVFRTVFGRPGAQVVRAAVDSLPGEESYVDNRASVAVEVGRSRIRVAYITNQPGPSSRALVHELSTMDRVECVPLVAEAGGLRPPARLDSADVYVLDGVSEGNDAAVWRAVAGRVNRGAGALVLAGPGFQPGPVLAPLVSPGGGASRAGSFAPDLTGDGAVLPWFGASAVPDSTQNLAAVPPFTGMRTGSPAGFTVWLKARDTGEPLMSAGHSGAGRVVYVAGYPLWRWGFTAGGEPAEGSALARFLAGVLRYLAESDTVRFRLETAKPGFYSGEPVRLVLKATAADGSPWPGLAVTAALRPAADTGKPAAGPAPHPGLPLTELGQGVYSGAADGVAAGEYEATAQVWLRDSLVGTARTRLTVLEQGVELARLGLNRPLLEQIAAAGGGRYFDGESVPGGVAITLGSYQRRLVIDPRSSVWAYVLAALLAAAEWFLRRRKGLL